ncbi:hypothetical protein [Cohnella sp. REN36]|uniref:hypothetical protein n=1 Tax=Cohnella sp. REN36 TaxID=2887347 RepID=UPI001D1441B9|nr:hypothetical protein [Cohnella sp. REN36]MCC3374128.1 hypothetical protein [Cohnella sp. REN36]
MKFEEAHALFLRSHLSKRKGERRGRLERGHQHGERLFLQQVWWPAYGHFDDLHPEYEILDWRGKPYFADFAWIKDEIRILIEIKGYGKHVQEMDRQGFCKEERRETFVHGIGYDLISFAYDDVEAQPQLCMMLLRAVLNQYLPMKPIADRVVLVEKETVKLAFSLARPIRPIDVIDHFGMNARTAAKVLDSLCAKGYLRPVPRGQGQRHVQYELVPGWSKRWS